MNKKYGIDDADIKAKYIHTNILRKSEWKKNYGKNEQNIAPRIPGLLFFSLCEYKSIINMNIHLHSQNRKEKKKQQSFFCVCIHYHK